MRDFFAGRRLSLCRGLLLLALFTVSSGAQSPPEDGKSLSPAVGQHEYPGLIWDRSGSRHVSVPVDVMTPFRITLFKKVKVIVEGGDAEIVNDSPREAETLRKWLSKSPEPGASLTEGVLSSGPPWFSPAKAGDERSVLEIRCKVDRIEANLSSRYIATGYTVFKQRIGLMHFTMSFFSNSAQLMKYSADEEFVMAGKPDLAFREIGDWTGKMLRALWKGEQVEAPAPVNAAASSPATPHIAASAPASAP